MIYTGGLEMMSSLAIPDEQISLLPFVVEQIAGTERIMLLPLGHARSKSWMHPLLTCDALILVGFRKNPDCKRRRLVDYFLALARTARRSAPNVNSNDSLGIVVTKGSTAHPRPAGMSRVRDTT